MAKQKQRGVENDSIKSNIKARQIFEALMKRIDAETSKEGVNLSRFWGMMAEKVTDMTGQTFTKEPDAIAVDPMTDTEARKFEGERIPAGCGKHGGEVVGDVPTLYWISINDSEFSKKVRRYVMSPWFQGQLDD